MNLQVPRYREVIRVTPTIEDQDHIPLLNGRLKSNNRFGHVDLVMYDPEGGYDSLIDNKHLLTLPDIYFSRQLIYTIVKPMLSERFEDLSFIQRHHVYFFTSSLTDYIDDEISVSSHSLETEKNPRERKKLKEEIDYYKRVKEAAEYLTHGRNLEGLVAVLKSRPEHI